MITDVAWFRGPTLLEDNADNVEIWRHRDRHFLRLYDVQNSSFYSCTALNTLGEVTHHFRLGLRKSKYCRLKDISTAYKKEVHAVNVT